MTKKATKQTEPDDPEFPPPFCRDYDNERLAAIINAAGILTGPPITGVDVQWAREGRRPVPVLWFQALYLYKQAQDVPLPPKPGQEIPKNNPFIGTF